jgi:hypothetical protein
MFVGRRNGKAKDTTSSRYHTPLKIQNIVQKSVRNGPEERNLSKI